MIVGVLTYGSEVFTSWNPLDKGSNVVLTNSNLTATVGPPSANLAQGAARSIINKTSGSWQYEGTYTAIAAAGDMVWGIDDGTSNLSAKNGVPGAFYYASGGQIVKAGSSLQTGLPTATVGDIITVAFIPSTSLMFFKNGIQLGTTIVSGLPSTMYAWIGLGRLTGTTSSSGIANFGATPLAFPVAGYNLGLF